MSNQELEFIPKGWRIKGSTSLNNENVNNNPMQQEDYRGRLQKDLEDPKKLLKSDFLNNIRELGISAAQGIPNLAAAPESIRKYLTGGEEPTTALGKGIQAISTPGRYISDQLEKLRNQEYANPEDYISQVAHTTASNLPFLLMSGPLTLGGLATDLIGSAGGIGAKELGLGVPGEIAGFLLGHKVGPKIVGKTAGALEKGAESLGKAVPSMENFTNSFRDQLGKHGFKDLANIVNMPPKKRQATLTRMYEAEPKYGSKVSIEGMKNELKKPFEEFYINLEKEKRLSPHVVEEIANAAQDFEKPTFKTASDLFNAKKSFGENFQTSIHELDRRTLGKVNDLYKDAFEKVASSGGKDAQRWGKYADTITELNKFKHWQKDLIDSLSSYKGLGKLIGLPFGAYLLNYLGVPGELLGAGVAGVAGYKGAQAFKNFITNPEGQKILSELMVGAAKKSPRIIGKSLKDINNYAEKYEKQQEQYIPKGWKIKQS